jgi:hypothetical protein
VPACPQEDVVVPLPLPSAMGALFLDKLKLESNNEDIDGPDLVFIDACHDYVCVLDDILRWYSIVR